MGKLHEVLAVEGDLATTSKKAIDEAIGTFSGHPDFFIESVIVQTYFDESNSHLNTTESKAMVTTVYDKLKVLAPAVSRYLDAYYVKEATNQHAKADVIVDGNVLVKDVPATALLGMETKLKDLRAVYEAIPTLQPGVHWKPDPTRSAGVYGSEDSETRFVTKRDFRPIIMAPATKEHPAQVQAVQEDVNVAKKVISNWSGMLSLVQKADLLNRVDILIRAVKKARQRANNQEAAEDRNFGKTFFDFIHSGIVE